MVGLVCLIRCTLCGVQQQKQKQAHKIMLKSLHKDKSPGSEADAEAQTAREQFTNPITKNTFEALPRIYGTRKKKKYALKYEFKPKQKNQQIPPDSSTSHPVPSYPKPLRDPRIVPLNIDKVQSSQRRFKTQMKTYDKKYTEQLSQPRPQFCTKRYCSCNKEHRELISKSESKMKIKNRPSKLLSLKLPEIQIATSPDDIESHHKVAMNFCKKTEGMSERNHLTLLDFLRGSQGQPMYQSNRPKIIKTVSVQEASLREKKDTSIQYPQKTNSVFVQTDYEQQQKEFQELGTAKGQTSTLDNYLPKKAGRRIGSSSSCRDEINKDNNRNNAQKMLKQEEDKLGQSNPRFKLQQLRARYKQILEEDSESDDNKSVVSSISSASLSKHIFDTDKKKTTIFHTLKKKESSNDASSVKLKSQSRIQAKNEAQKKPLFQKKNGLFVIPEEDQYVDYLKNYQPINQKFAIKKLVRKENFKVVPDEEGVFFGQLVDSKKNGKGLMVTERSVFQGQYKNDLKYYGCERNIDGVYKGEFVNGIREGYGTFQWYNGEIFEGEWKNGTKNGFGVWKSPRGDFYEGNWLLNRQHGKGIYKHRLSTYRGQFSQFLKNGSGEQIFSNGDKYVGSYKKGKPDGKGRYDWADGSYYEGDFSNGVREGRGKWVFSNGTVYEGQFKNDFKEGHGKEIYTSGERFQGTFKEGNKYEGTLYDQQRNAIKITPSQ